MAKHVTPYLGGLPIGKITPQAVRQWRAELIGNGVSATMAAKSYRLLHAVLATAVEDDKLLPRNPFSIRGAGSEHSAERPVLTVAQVFALAERVGCRPPGNIRQVPGNGYRLRFRQDGRMQAAPGSYATRKAADAELRSLADAGRVDCETDRRYRALVLLAAFASLRGGEATALRRCDIDLNIGAIRCGAAFVERSTGELVLGPPKSRAGRRVAGHPAGHPPRPARPHGCLRRPGPDVCSSPARWAGRCAAETPTGGRLAARRRRDRGSGLALS